MIIIDEIQNDNMSEQWKIFDRFCRDTDKIQERVLMDILAKNANCQIGKQFKFDTIKSIDQFRENVPIQDWNDIMTFIDDTVNGKQDILTQGLPVKRFIITSGTTEKPKLIPENELTIKANSITMRLRINSILRDHPEILSGSLFPLFNIVDLGKTKTGVPIESASSSTFFGIGKQFESIIAYPPEIFQISSQDTLDYLMFRFALHNNVTVIAGNIPDRINKLFAFADYYKDELIHDIENGIISEKFEIDPGVREALYPLIEPDQKRAKELQEMVQKNRTLKPEHYWPGLRLILCWKSGIMKRFLLETQKWCSKDVIFREFGYGASEGKFTIPIGDELDSGALALHSAFFEFLPVDHGKENKTVLAHELEKGKEYELIITNNSGFYRYAIHDIVCVDGFFKKCPIISFVRKTSDTINLVGEKVSSKILITSFERVSSFTDIHIRHFYVVPDVERLLYHIFIEPQEEKTVEFWQSFVKKLDEIIGEINIPYDYYRKQNLIHAPELSIMEKGWLNAIVKEKAGQSTGSNQIKPPVVGTKILFPHMKKISVQGRIHENFVG